MKKLQLQFRWLIILKKNKKKEQDAYKGLLLVWEVRNVRLIFNKIRSNGNSEITNSINGANTDTLIDLKNETMNEVDNEL